MGRYDGRLRKERKTSTIQHNEVSSKQTIRNNIRTILKKDASLLTKNEKELLTKNEDFVQKLDKNQKAATLRKSRLLEIEDDACIVMEQCKKLAEALKTNKHVIVYTGAGISTSANIPDFRGAEGVWTKLSSNVKINLEHSLTKAEPTVAHMVLKKLYDGGIVKHIVSQNCDGLHLRSGLPQNALSEIHGNMYLEICTECDNKIYRIFDVTEKTSLRRHNTGRICESCQEELKDTIVHFGERSKLRWPHNWRGAVENAEKSDLILCLGSSLKVLRSYKHLWMTDRPKHKRPQLYIVNLQWTPKDTQASMKIHSRIDFVMETVCNILGLSIPTYSSEQDPLYSLATPSNYEGQRMPIPLTYLEKFESIKPANFTTKDKAKSTLEHFQCTNSIDPVIKNEFGTIKMFPEKAILPHTPCTTDDNPTQYSQESDVSSTSTNANNVPAWFGKGVKSKINSIKKKKRWKNRRK
uniref:NAD-dependent protein deacetylase sirtuin-7-like n=1 Tax=Styela clava TaxID=7725 RepID=UPI00193AD629|nr:NAD-dependent protein deacetylase sirtuin-7-like [Styela clava]